MKLLLGIFTLVIFVQIVTSACPNETYIISDSIGTKWPCVYFANYPLSFANAEYACESRSGHLIPIPNGFINTYISRRFRFFI